MAIFASAVATFLAIGLAFGGGSAGLVVAQLVGLAGTALVATWWLTGGLAALGVAPPRLRAGLGAVLVGASFWYVNLRISLPVADWLGAEDEVTSLQSRWFTGRPLGELLILLAVVPAVAEELLCRGLLARALKRRFPTWLAVGASAVAFSLLHVSVARALPTFTLGLVLGWIALEADSVWPAVLAHAINNAAAVAIGGGAVPDLSAAMTAHGDVTLAIAGAVTLAGGALVISAQRNRPDTRT